jgi:hypothetical protein
MAESLNKILTTLILAEPTDGFGKLTYTQVAGAGDFRSVITITYLDRAIVLEL